MPAPIASEFVATERHHHRPGEAGVAACSRRSEAGITPKINAIAAVTLLVSPALLFPPRLLLRRSRAKDPGRGRRTGGRSPVSGFEIIRG